MLTGCGGEGGGVRPRGQAVHREGEPEWGGVLVLPGCLHLIFWAAFYFSGRFCERIRSCASG